MTPAAEVEAPSQSPAVELPAVESPVIQHGISRSISGELKKLMRQSSHYVLGLVGSLAMGFVSFPIFTRMFSVSDYGLIDFAQKILTLIVILGKVGMQHTTLRFFDGEKFDKTPGASRQYYSTMLLGVGAVASVVTVLFALGVLAMPASIVDRPLAIALLLIAGLIVARSLQSIQQAFMRIEERTRDYNISNLALKAAVLAGVLLFAWKFGPSVTSYLSGMVVAEIIVTAVLCITLVRRGLLHWKSVDRSMLTAGLAFGAPLILQELAGTILDTGDRTLVRAYLGGDALGLYTVAYGLAGYVNTLMMGPLGLAILPIYMRIWRSEGKEKTIEFLSIGLDTFLLASAGIFALATVASRDAVDLLASAKYHAAAPLIPTLVAGMLIYSVQVFLNAGLLIHKKTTSFGTALAISAVLNMGLNCILLPRMGTQGAAIATLVSYACCTAILAFLSSRVLQLRFQLRSLIGYLGAATVTCLTIGLVDLHSVLWNLIAKSLLTVILYAALVLTIDSRIRLLALNLSKKLTSRFGV